MRRDSKYARWIRAVFCLLIVSLFFNQLCLMPVDAEDVGVRELSEQGETMEFPQTPSNRRLPPIVLSHHQQHNFGGGNSSPAPVANFTAEPILLDLPVLNTARVRRCATRSLKDFINVPVWIINCCRLL